MSAPAHKIRVLVSGGLPPPLGGLGAFYETLLASSLRQRVDLSFVTTSTQLRSFERGGKASLQNLLYGVEDIFRFAKALVRHRPQVAHIGTSSGLSFAKHSICVVLARIGGSRVLVHPHCSVSALYGARPWWWQWGVRRVLSMAHGLVAVSTEWASISEFAPRCKVYHVPNAVNVTEFDGIATRRLAAGDLPGAPQVVYLGHIGRDKGSFDLIEAARRSVADGCDWWFELIGGELLPGDRSALLEAVSAAGISDRVAVRRPVLGADRLSAFARADVFVYPSYHEGMPMAVIEAMAAALPIIATGVGGLPDLIEDGVNGILIEPGRPEQIVEAIKRVTSDPALMKTMQRSSYRRAQQLFDFEKRVPLLVDIYHAALGK